MYPMLWGWATWKDRWELNTGVVPENFKKILDCNKVSKKIGKIAFRSWKKKIMNYNMKMNHIYINVQYVENKIIKLSIDYNF